MASTKSTSSRPQSRSSALVRSNEDSSSTETTPLLINRDDAPQTGNSEEVENKLGRWQRWPSMVALLLLSILAVVIMLVGFLMPQAVREYAAEALVFQPTSLSIESFTPFGVNARIQGDFTLDASRVKNRASRNLGRFVTSIAKMVESGPSELEVSLPDYGDVILGIAAVPGIRIDIRNRHTTRLDFLSELQPGSKDGIRRLANDWVDGKISQLRLKGQANVEIKSGRFHLGSHPLAQYLELKGKDIPTMPDFNISRLEFHDNQKSDQHGLITEASLQVSNEYPLDFVVPALDFSLYVENCSPDQPFIKIADAHTGSVHLKPRKDLDVKVAGLIHDLPEAVLTACPGSHKSPLDSILGEYIQGGETTVYVRGSNKPSPNTPKWLAELMSQLTVPVPFPGHALGHLIKDFSLKNVHFQLPDPDDNPDSGTVEPMISADVRALISVPEEMNFPIKVHRFKAAADVYYHGQKLGYLDADEWRPAASKAVKNETTGHEDLEVISRMEKVPLTITDDDVFVDVVQDLLYSKRTIFLTIKADVDVSLETSLGEFVVRKIPTEGEVPIQRKN